MLLSVMYDGTYEGWLTAVFEVYEYRLKDVCFTTNLSGNSTLFAPPHQVHTNAEKAQRVLAGLKQRMSEQGFQNLYKTFLSEADCIEEVLWSYVQYVLSSKENVETHFNHPAVLTITQTARKVFREAHRMEAFVRFQLTKDGLYYAVVEPDCNVLPLLIDHFKSRYSDQRWLIYDVRRKYGIYYDLEQVTNVELYFNDGISSSSIAEISDEREELFQQLWRRYFESVNIKARKNMRLHIQHMPKRYWKYLTEKQPHTGLSQP